MTIYFQSFLVQVLNCLIWMLIASLKICLLFVQVPLDLAPTLSHQPLLSVFLSSWNFPSPCSHILTQSQSMISMGLVFAKKMVTILTWTSSGNLWSPQCSLCKEVASCWRELGLQCQSSWFISIIWQFIYCLHNPREGSPCRPKKTVGGLKCFVLRKLWESWYLGKLTSETTFGHSKVSFRPLLHKKRFVHYLGVNLFISTGTKHLSPPTVFFQTTWGPFPGHVSQEIITQLWFKTKSCECQL